MPFVHASPPLLDFSRPKVVQRFPVINHVIMGGVLTSRLVSSGGAMEFEGQGSLENNGGFTSLHGPLASRRNPLPYCRRFVAAASAASSAARSSVC